MSELTKEQIKGPDKFQKFSKSLIDWIQKNSKGVMGAAIAFMVLGVAYAGYDLYRERVEDKARVALYKAQKLQDDIARQEQEAKQKEEEAKAAADKAAKDKKAKAAATPAPAPVDVAGLKASALKAYGDVIRDYPGTAASHIAVLQSSQVLLDEKKTDEAVQLFEKNKEPSRGQSLLLGAYLSQKGKVLAQKGDCESAVREWERVINNPNLSIWHGDSLVKAGVCYEKLNKKDKAVELYKKAVASHGETDAGRAAKKFLILAERPQPKG
ncbi:MAG TPA: tetratricopeptide repeat protein [Bdellovibrionales bacterium]|nr:tetratricopeptide repeat protein [Bdellovibrionales bacterium]